MSALRHCLPVVLALACATACSRPGGDDARVGSAPASSTAASVLDSHLPLVERIQVAPLRVPHSGVRKLSFYYEAEGGSREIAYTERVTADGHGRFAIDPIDVDTPAMTVAQLQVFELVQKQRQGFFFRYRDFGVRQRELFLANYSIQVLGQGIDVAGRPCTQLDIRRLQSPTTWYRVAVDIGTGLVLRWSELTTDDRLLARGEFSELTLDPILDGVDWFESHLEVEPFQPGQSEAQALGFQPHAVQILPPGYQLLRSELVVDNGVNWLRRVYGDGVENLFVLERGPAPAPAPGTASSAARSNAWYGGNNPPPVVVRLCQVDAWTLAEATQGTAQLLVIGKIGEDEVLACLRSAF